MRKRASLTFAAVILIASAAWALTEQDLQDEADRLIGVQADLATRIAACPGGTCSEAATIQSDLGDASDELGQLETDRASLPGCSCAQVDEDIADLQAAQAAQEDIVDDWTQAPGRDGRIQPML